jgi:hypothetical protein
MKAQKLSHPNTIYGVATVQEEVGLRGGPNHRPRRRPRRGDHPRGGHRGGCSRDQTSGRPGENG